MRSLLLDLNVVLDVLLDRKPHVESAAVLWAAAERGRMKAFLPAHGVTTIHDLIRKQRGATFATRAVADLLRVFDVAPVDSEVLRAALALRMNDFEDAVCAQSAAAAGCDAVVSRDPTGYRGSPLPILSPGEAAVLVGKTSKG